MYIIRSNCMICVQCTEACGGNGHILLAGIKFVASLYHD